MEVRWVAAETGIVGVGEEDDAGLESFGLMEVHEADDVFLARFQGHFFDVIIGVVDQVAEFAQDLAPVKTLGFPLVGKGQNAVEVARSGGSLGLGSGKGKEAQGFQGFCNCGSRGEGVEPVCGLRQAVEGATRPCN